jgi:site-specific DNA-methyltransferase (adenine-specific)
LKHDRYCVTFCGWTEIAAFAQAWADAGFRTIGHIVWPKRYASSCGHTRYQHESAFLLAKGFPVKPDDPISDVQRWEYTGNKEHPTQKAVSVMEPLVTAFSHEGDLVLDPFAGSGTTCVAAALNGRRTLGIELEPRYCELARRRLAGAARYLAEAA